MPIHDILQLGNPLLRGIAQPVTDSASSEVAALLADLRDTLAHCRATTTYGRAIAAPQIGVLKRLIVIDTSPRQPEQKLIHLVNPEIVKVEGKLTYTEGCLSIPGEAEDVDRAAKVWVRALGRDGKPFEIVAEGDLLAVALQHEHDHLQGTLFVDHLSSLKRELIKRRMKKMKAQRLADIRDAPRHESAL